MKSRKLLPDFATQCEILPAEYSIQNFSMRLVNEWRELRLKRESVKAGLLGRLGGCLQVVANE
ncbi:MAG: hypothetical protein WCJ66_18925 [Verrucomicrobiota bacterium]